MKIFGLNKHSGAKLDKAHQIQHANMLHVLANDPFLDWLLILLGAFTVTIALVVIGGYMYLETGNSISAPAPEIHRTAMSRVNTSALNNVLDEFDRRAAERALPARSYVAPKDPSLP